MKFVGERIQSEIYVGFVGDRKAIKKVSGHGLSQEELEQVVVAVPQYRESLRGRVNVPDNISTRIVNSTVETIDDYVEGHMVTYKGKKEWRKMVEIMTTDVFMDAKPPNFVQNGKQMYYVDMFPPMLKENNVIAPWIQKLYKRDRDMMTFNFGDVRGKLTKLLSLTKLEMPDRYDELARITLDVAKNNIRIEYFEYVLHEHQLDFPDMQSMYSHPELSGVIARRIIHGINE